MTARQPRLVFVSPLFLFPNDAGGKIRTTNILRGLKGGAFHITLISVATPEQVATWRDPINTVCDQFVPWQPTAPKPKWQRATHLFKHLPVNVVADQSQAGRQAVEQALASGQADLVVFDFVHAAVLAPATLPCASICFTHNVEAEIFLRHATQASNPLQRWLWSSQYQKMKRYEQESLRRFTAVVAVSERDAKFFASSYGIQTARAIPTGVDLDFFAWQAPPAVGTATPPTIVFTGSMDWAANVNGVRFFLKDVWPSICSQMPSARFVVVGRSPPAALVAEARGLPNVSFTGFVDDVRPYVHAAHAFVIPLLVGGGTRIKAFEAMAMGCPVVSTALGMEGLGAAPSAHYLECDQAAQMAQELLALLNNPAQQNLLSKNARTLVEDKFGHTVAAKAFEQICLEALPA